jgi:hypothetical protein
MGGLRRTSVCVVRRWTRATPFLDDRKCTDAVLTGEGTDVGLTNPHCGDAELVSGAQSHGAEHDRGGAVDDVRFELRERPLHGRVGKPHSVTMATCMLPPWRTRVNGR